MEHWLNHLLTALPDGNLFVASVGLVALLEGIVGIGLIFPGAIITVLAGFMASHGKGHIVLVMAAAGGGAIIGDLLSYLLGARFGSRLWGRGLLRKHLDLLRKAQAFFFEHGGKGLFFGRFIGPLRGLVPFIAGAAHMRPLPFLGWAVTSGLLWGIAYPGAGFLGGSSWELARSLSGGLGMAVVLLAIVIVAVVALRRRLF